MLKFSEREDWVERPCKLFRIGHVALGYQRFRVLFYAD
jgi:hypothetical protein